MLNKKIIISAWLILSFFLVTVTVHGEEQLQTVTGEDEVRSDLYSYRRIDDGIMITNYWGEETFISIPEHIDGQIVRVIGQDSFADNETAWIITVPKTVYTIEDNAFWNCSLRQIYLPEGLKCIGNSVFASSKLVSVYLPESIESIGRFTFWECKNLYSVHIASGIDLLPVGTFADCSNLTEVFLNDSIQKIDSDAFAYCFSLKRIHFPANLQSVPYTIFADSKELDDDVKRYLEKIVFYAVDEDDE